MLGAGHATTPELRHDLAELCIQVPPDAPAPQRDDRPDRRSIVTNLSRFAPIATRVKLREAR
jgi:hypothetical protein